jgi:two-component system LytT family response regulator
VIASLTPSHAAVTPLRTLLVDDEPLARERMRMLLGRHADVQVLAECRDGAEAVGAIGALEPDVVFLDVEMPSLDGFGVLQQLEGRLPTVVFVSGHDGYAVRAFETHAIDYLLKPVAAERVDRSLARIRARRAEMAQAGRPAEPDLRALLAHLRGESIVPAPARRSGVERLTVKANGQLILLPAAEIEYIEASGNYVQLHARNTQYTMRETMKHMEDLLDGGQFVRIHRRAIVNVQRIQALEPWMHGERVVIMASGTRLMASRVYADRLKAAIR